MLRFIQTGGCKIKQQGIIPGFDAIPFEAESNPRRLTFIRQIIIGSFLAWGADSEGKIGDSLHLRIFMGGDVEVGTITSSRFQK